MMKKNYLLAFTAFFVVAGFVLFSQKTITTKKGVVPIAGKLSNQSVKDNQQSQDSKTSVIEKVKTSSAKAAIQEPKSMEIATYLPPRKRINSLTQTEGLQTSKKGIEAAKEFLANHAEELGLISIEQARLVDSVPSSKSGIEHFYFRQTHNGLDVLNADLNIAVNKEGEIVTANSTFIDVESSDQSIASEVQVSVADAVTALVNHLGWENVNTSDITQFTPGEQTEFDLEKISNHPVKVKLHYVPTEDSMDLAYNINVRSLDGMNWYDTSVSAVDGRVVGIRDWVANASYRVFNSEERHPGTGSRTLEIDPEDELASPFGWNDTDGVAGAEATTTRGNYADVYDNSTSTSFTYRPSGGSDLVFDFNYSASSSISNNRDAAMANAYYMTNICHDFFYQYGFDEASGNFQNHNYSGASGANDAVKVSTQTSDFPNAFFATPPDGEEPEMYLFTYNGKNGAFSNQIITHEYGHGVSNRLTGGKSNANALEALQSGGMGEGWGDWWSMMLSQKSTDQANDSRVIGEWFLDPTGIRQYPYTYNMGVNPLTYAMYPINTQVHSAGTIWCSALWDMTWELIDGFGFDEDVYNGNGGNNVALNIVMEGLKLQGANPSFLDARDAILLADQQLYGGLHKFQIWKAFARRGMGSDAYDGGSANSSNIVAGFNIPEDAFGANVTAVDHEFNELSQINDGFFSPGESLEATFKAKNVGPTLAQDVELNISTTHSGVTVATNYMNLGDISNGASTAEVSLSISIDETVAHGSIVGIQYDFNDSSDDGWSTTEYFTVNKVITFTGTVSSLTGNTPLGGSTVDYTGPLSGRAFTNSSGVYHFSTIVGDYKLTVKNSSYNSLETEFAYYGTDQSGVDFALGRSIITLSEESLSANVNYGSTSSQDITISNNGDHPMAVSLSHSGVSEAFSSTVQTTGYSWSDSNDVNGSVPYEWQEISTIGTKLAISNNDDNYTSAALDFNFPFYGNDYNSVFVSTNGYLTFGEGSKEWANRSLPNRDVPGNLVAAFFDDLSPLRGGNIYVLSEDDRFVVQFDNVRHLEGTDTVTFQIVLNSDGTIYFYYKEMNGNLSSATVGIQSGNKKDALEVAYNTNYTRDELAVKIEPVPTWISYDFRDSNGIVEPGMSVGVRINFNTQGLSVGNHYASLRIGHDSPSRENPLLIPVTMTITPALPSAPVATSDSYRTLMNSELSVPNAGVLENDFDLNADELTAIQVSDAANGSITFNSDGSFSYTPREGFFGRDSFTYKANDGFFDSEVVQVFIEVAQEEELFPQANGTLAAEWNHAGNNNWIGDNTEVNEGNWSLKSGAITGGQTSVIELTKYMSAGVINFDYKVSSERDYDKLRVYLDGGEILEASGSIDWASFSQEVSAGIHTVSFVYSKDASVNVGNDTAWIDNFSYPLPPIYTVEFDLDGGDLISGELIQKVVHGYNAVAPRVSPPLGYRFIQWSVGFENVTRKLTVVAAYAALEENPEDWDQSQRYRLYNTADGNHHWTTNYEEYSQLVDAGWIGEGSDHSVLTEAFASDVAESEPLYRLYNPNSGEHHWTLSIHEYETVAEAGWIKEGIDGYAFSMNVQGTTALYRLYNPNSGLHHYTTDLYERSLLINVGWIDEGISAYVFRDDRSVQ